MSYTYNLSPLYYSPEPQSSHDFDQLFLGLDNGTIADISHKPSDFIKGCMLRNQVTIQCRVLMANGGIKRFLGSSYGLCYTYNFNVSSSNLELDVAQSSKEATSLELIFDLEGKCQMGKLII